MRAALPSIAIVQKFIVKNDQESMRTNRSSLIRRLRHEAKSPDATELFAS
jgi:hypothetical protein